MARTLAQISVAPIKTKRELCWTKGSLNGWTRSTFLTIYDRIPEDVTEKLTVAELADLVNIMYGIAKEAYLRGVKAKIPN